MKIMSYKEQLWPGQKTFARTGIVLTSVCSTNFLPRPSQPHTLEKLPAKSQRYHRVRPVDETLLRHVATRLLLNTAHLRPSVCSNNHWSRLSGQCRVADDNLSITPSPTWKLRGQGDVCRKKVRMNHLTMLRWLLIQNTQEIKRTLFNWTKQDKTCKFSRKSSFSSYVQHKNRKINNIFNLSCVSWMWEAGGRKRARDWLTW